MSGRTRRTSLAIVAAAMAAVLCSCNVLHTGIEFQYGTFLAERAAWEASGIEDYYTKAIRVVYDPVYHVPTSIHYDVHIPAGCLDVFPPSWSITEFAPD